jgi:hypothetical protein
MVFLMAKRNAHEKLPYQRRGNDTWGGGDLGDSRGDRPHLGVDYVVLPGEPITAPFDFQITGPSFPYADTLSLTGVQGKTPEGYDVRIWYLVPNPLLFGANVMKGDVIGLAQSLQKRYPGITDHIHVQVSTPKSIPGGLVWNGRTYLDYA